MENAIIAFQDIILITIKIVKSCHNTVKMQMSMGIVYNVRMVMMLLTRENARNKRKITVNNMPILTKMENTLTRTVQVAS